LDFLFTSPPIIHSNFTNITNFEGKLVLQLNYILKNRDCKVIARMLKVQGC